MTDTNLIQQCVDLDDYAHGWKNKAGENIVGMDVSSPDENQEVNDSPAILKETEMSTMAELDHDLQQMDGPDPEDAYLLEVINELDLDEPITMEEVVEGQTTANKYLYVIKKMRDEIENVKAVGQDQIKSAEAYINSESKKRENTIAFLSQRLHLYMMGQDQKTINLPNGALKMRAMQDKVNVVDEPKVLAWIKDQGFPQTQMLRIKEMINKAEIRKYIKESGEIPDGVDVETQEPSFSVVTK